jgi:hypothetical protein
VHVRRRESPGLIWCKETQIFSRALFQNLLNTAPIPFYLLSATQVCISKNRKIKIYRTVILPVVLYGCETFSLTLREEHRLLVFKNRVLRNLLRTERDKVPAGWKRLHNKDLYDLYFALNTIQIIKTRII